MLHNARIVSLDGSPHPPANVTFWNGDSRGHWEGDTLVVDTTNYRQDPKRHVVEHFTRTADNYVTWTITYDEPATYVKPYTEEIPLRHTEDSMYEYACHEGNYGLQGILAGARAEEDAGGSRGESWISHRLEVVLKALAPIVDDGVGRPPTPFVF